MRPRAINRASIFLAAAALLLSGCAGYTLGDKTPLPFRSLHVAPPVNASLAPQAAAPLGVAVTREIDRSGRLTIQGPSTAEARLEIRITNLHREPTVSRRDDSGLGRRWRETLTAEVTLRDTRSDKVYFQKRTVSAFDEVYADDGLVPSEYQSLPALTTRLAEAIALEVLSVW